MRPSVGTSVARRPGPCWLTPAPAPSPTSTVGVSKCAKSTGASTGVVIGGAVTTAPGARDPSTATSTSSSPVDFGAESMTRPAEGPASLRGACLDEPRSDQATNQRPRAAKKYKAGCSRGQNIDVLHLEEKFLMFVVYTYTRTLVTIANVRCCCAAVRGFLRFYRGEGALLILIVDNPTRNPCCCCSLLLCCLLCCSLCYVLLLCYSWYIVRRNILLFSSY